MNKPLSCYKSPLWSIKDMVAVLEMTSCDSVCFAANCEDTPGVPIYFEGEQITCADIPTHPGRTILCSIHSRSCCRSCSEEEETQARECGLYLGTMALYSYA